MCERFWFWIFICRVKNPGRQRAVQAPWTSTAAMGDPIFRSGGNYGICLEQVSSWPSFLGRKDIVRFYFIFTLSSFGLRIAVVKAYLIFWTPKSLAGIL